MGGLKDPKNPRKLDLYIFLSNIKVLVSLSPLNPIYRIYEYIIFKLFSFLNILVSTCLKLDKNPTHSI